MSRISDLPAYGVGVEWSVSLEKTLAEHLRELALIELIPENFFRQGEAFLTRLAAAGTPTVIHGVELSIGSLEPLKFDHLERMLAVAARVNTVMFSDHLAMTEHSGVEIGQLTPLQWTPAVADAVAEKILQVQSRIDVPFAIENITNRFQIPGCEMTEPAFINRILRATGCGLQLDLNNVDTNAYNFGFDARAWIDALDLDRVVSVHLAGGVMDEDGVLLDSHNAPVRDRVWDLYRHVTRQVLPKSTIVEWTDDTPPLAVLMDQVRRAESILAARTGEVPT